MAQPGFIFGEGTADTYESLQAKRKTAERLGLAAMRTPQNLGEGLSSLGQAIAYRRLMGQADRGDAAGRAAYESGPRASALAGLFGASLGGGPRISSSGTWSPDAPAPKPTDLPYHGGSALNFPGAGGMDSGVMGAKGDLGFGSATMTPQEMLTAGAEARGLNPIDVATAISYETGGKFDPMISGPTTQWGTHQGLIQFGEPQAAEHGADFTDPTTAMRSQLNPTNGAVWSYLDAAGVKPGMGLDDVYSAINAGAPGRYGASDANNGGAPGTVADKVAGMGDHRGTAADWLGGTWTPSDTVTVSTQGQQPAGGDIGMILEAMSNPYATPEDKAVFGMLLEQRMTAMQPQSESERLDLLLKQAELDKIQNPAVDPMDAVALAQAELNLEQDRTGAGDTNTPAGYRELELRAIDAGLVKGSPEYKQFMLTGGGGIGEDTPAAFQALKLQAIDAGLVPGSDEYKQFMLTKGAGDAALAKGEGTALAEDTALLDNLKSKLPGLKQVVTELENLADEATYTGTGQAVDWTMKQLGMDPRESAVARTEYTAMVDNQVLPMLRDTFGAQFTVAEGETLRSTLGDPDKSPSEKKAVLRAFIEQKVRNIQALEQRVAPTGTADTANMSDDEFLQWIEGQ